MVILVAAITGTLAFELINPITGTYRGLLFGATISLSILVAIFLFDLLVAPHGWCSRLCPMGAAYGLLGKVSLLRVSAKGRDRCDDCLDCFSVCPEIRVIGPALRGGKTGASPVILSGDCTNCGRCIDVCPDRIHTATHRFDHRLEADAADADSTPPDSPARPRATV